MFLLYSCLSGHDDKMSDILDDAELLLQDQSLQRILDRDTLIALTDYNSTNYFIYRGEPMGYQFEMLQQFADFLDVNLKLVISSDMNQAFDLLNNEKVDVIAMGLTVTSDRQKLVDFTL
ncbi:MAG: lytic transglycosylase F, partial [Bacteroidetes bacterium]